jgi:hypothetical protein
VPQDDKDISGIHNDVDGPSSQPYIPDNDRSFSDPTLEFAKGQTYRANRGLKSNSQIHLNNHLENSPT